jgi:hypothetical protein
MPEVPMREPSATLLAALAVILVAPARAASPPAGTTVSLVWFDPEDMLPGAFEDARQEIDAIFRGIGVEVRWRRGGGGSPYVSPERPEVAVILLSEDRSHGPSSVMGLVRRGDTPSRVAWVFVNNVRTTLSHLPLKARPGPAEIPELARAVARVAAHEVVHAIAPEAPHARNGLMNEALSRRFLLGESATIDARCASAVLLRLAALPAPREASIAPGPVSFPGF